MKLKFIKLDIEIMNDAKIKVIRKMPDGDRLVLMWIWLICLGMKSGVAGTLQLGEGISYTDELLASELGMELNTVRMGIKAFQELKMLEIFYGTTYYLTNFEKHQELSKIERNNEQNRMRVQKCRERKKLKLIAPNNVMITSPLRNGDVTPPDIDKEIDLNIDKQTDMKVCLSDFKNTKEYKNVKMELMARGWSGSFDSLVKEIGWEPCLHYWENQLCKEYDAASTKLGGGWITNKFRKDANSFYQYHKEKEEVKIAHELSILKNLKEQKEKYTASQLNFLTDFHAFIESNGHSELEKRQLKNKSIKSIEDLTIKPDGILDSFLNWKGIR